MKILSVLVILSALVFVASVESSLVLAESESKPGRVTSVETEVYHGRKIMVRWEPPTKGGEPNRYLVQAKRAGEKPIRQIVKTGSPYPRARFICLDLGETYKIRVRAINDAGKGPVTVRSVNIPDNEAYIVPVDSKPCPDGNY